MTTVPTPIDHSAPVPVAALPDEPAEDRHQQSADQDVVGDGERRDDVVEQCGDHDHDDAEDHDVEPVGVHDPSHSCRRSPSVSRTSRDP